MRASEKRLAFTIDLYYNDLILNWAVKQSERDAIERERAEAQLVLTRVLEERANAVLAARIWLRVAQLLDEELERREAG